MDDRDYWKRVRAKAEVVAQWPAWMRRPEPEDVVAQSMGPHKPKFVEHPACGQGSVPTITADGTARCLAWLEAVAATEGSDG